MNSPSIVSHPQSLWRHSFHIRLKGKPLGLRRHFFLNKLFHKRAQMWFLVSHVLINVINHLLIVVSTPPSKSSHNSWFQVTMTMPPPWHWKAMHTVGSQKLKWTHSNRTKHSHQDYGEDEAHITPPYRKAGGYLKCFVFLWLAGKFSSSWHFISALGLLSRTTLKRG